MPNAFADDVITSRRLAAEVLRAAVEDMQGKVPSGIFERSARVRTRISAVTWLASRDATRWFDVVGIDQLTALERSGWPRYARAMLRAKARTPRGGGEPIPLTAAERRLIDAGLAVVHDTGDG